MKRFLTMALLLLALPAMAEKWVDDYNRGVAAVRAKNYAAGADALQSAIAVMPKENAQARVHNEIFTYVPHFWLGIAKFNLGEIDAALGEWKTSEEQGVVQNTIYFAQLRNWQSTAKDAKQRNAENAAAASKRDANAAVSRAVSASIEAAKVGANRSDSYRAAQGKLSEALETFNKAGIDVRAYKRAGDLAAQAHDLFVASAEEAKRLRAARPVPVPQPPAPQPKPIVIPQPQPPAPQPPAPVPQPKEIVPEPQLPQVSAALMNARVAVQQYHRRLLDLKMPTKDADRLDRELAGTPSEKTIARVMAQLTEKERELDRHVAEAAATRPPVQVDDVRPALESAYRAYAVGDLAGSESMLTRILDTHRSGEAYLLRGVARYTRAMLSRTPEPLLSSAADDFRTALKINAALRIGNGDFSPKVVKFFDDVRQGR